MAIYSIKIVDHTESAGSAAESIQSELQGFFNRVFAGTSDRATVAWGQGSAGDTIVLHYVENVTSSYIARTMPRPPEINSLAGGHTSLRNRVICSEFYRTVTTRRGARVLRGRDAAKLAFHECLHNVFPAWTEQDLMGHGGLADTPVGPDLNQWDIDTMRRGIAIKSVATQQL